MKFKKEGQVITIEISETESVTFFEMTNRGANLVAGCQGNIGENEFRYEGMVPKKYGRGKFKAEKEMFATLDEVEKTLLENGYRLTF